METYEAMDLLDEQSRWQDVRYDEDGNPNTCFPYPPKFIRSEAQGELADRIRNAFLREANESLTEELQYAPVTLTEKTVYGGYSEYTQENLTYLKVQWGEHEKEFSDHDYDDETGSYLGSSLNALLFWMDKMEGTTRV